MSYEEERAVTAEGTGADLSSDSKTYTGVVKWFNAEKGYGFITGEDGNDIFVHHTAIQCEGYRTLDEGQRVSYQVTEGKPKANGEKGMQAANVIKL